MTTVRATISNTVLFGCLLSGIKAFGAVKAMLSLYFLVEHYEEGLDLELSSEDQVRFLFCQ